MTQDQAMRDWFKNLKRKNKKNYKICKILIKFKVQGNVQKVQAVRSYLRTMMKMFKNKGTALRSYADYKLSTRINQNAHTIFQDKAFSHAVSWKNGILQGFVLIKSIKALKRGAATARNRKCSEKKMNFNFKNAIEFSPEEFKSPRCDMVCSDDNSMPKSPKNLFKFINENTNLLHNIYENERESILKTNNNNNDTILSENFQSYQSTFVKPLPISEKMKDLKSSLVELKLLSFIKDKYEENNKSTEVKT